MRDVPCTHCDKMFMRPNNMRSHCYYKHGIIQDITPGHPKFGLWVPLPEQRRLARQKKAEEKAKRNKLSQPIPTQISGPLSSSPPQNTQDTPATPSSRCLSPGKATGHGHVLLHTPCSTTTSKPPVPRRPDSKLINSSFLHLNLHRSTLTMTICLMMNCRIFIFKNCFYLLLVLWCLEDAVYQCWSNRISAKSKWFCFILCLQVNKRSKFLKENKVTSSNFKSESLYLHENLCHRLYQYEGILVSDIVYKLIFVYKYIYFN